MNIKIDGMEFIFLIMGYGFGMLEFGLKRGWVIIGFMIVAMVLQNFYRINVVLKR